MAIYHLEAKAVSRGGGRSAVAAAAYLSCSKMTNEYDGVDHDYTRKGGLVWEECFVPPFAPQEWKDREALWNAVEEAEKTKDSRLARELVVALPIEMNHDQQIQLIREYVQENFVEEGMCADAAIHDTDGHNPHAHILLTVRPLDEQGRWQYKSKKEYLCIRDGVEQGFTAEEFQNARDQGWEKQYQYLVEGKKTYLPPSQAEGLERVCKTPKSTRFGRQNPIAEKWNSDEQLVQWRANWAETTNRNLERIGVDARIDHRTLKEQGIEGLPTIHEGVTARAMEKEGHVADRCEINRQIKASNKILRELRRQIDRLVEAAKKSIPAIAQALDALREHMIMLRCQIFHNNRQRKAIKQEYSWQTKLLEEYRQLKTQLMEKRSAKKQLTTEIQALRPLQFKKSRELKSQQATVVEEIEELKTRKSFLLDRMDCTEQDIPKAETTLRNMTSSIDLLIKQNESLEAQNQADLQDYQKLMESVPKEDTNQLERLLETLGGEHHEELILHCKGRNKSFHLYEDLFQAEKTVSRQIQNLTEKHGKEKMPERNRTTSRSYER